MINHPLAIGKIKISNPVVAIIDTPQRVKLTSVRLKNTDPLTRTVKISVYARGESVGLTPDVNQVSIDTGNILELITPDNPIILDQGCVIIGIADKDSVIEYIIDGVEDFKME